MNTKTETDRNYRQIDNPPDEQLSPIIDGLNAYGLEQVGGEKPQEVAVVCEEGTNRDVFAGAAGHSICGRFYLNLLWVAEEHRSQGGGSELMTRVEAVARSRGCKDVLVDTLNKKAVSFYQGLGYEVYLVNPGYIRGFDWHFLVKPLG